MAPKLSLDEFLKSSSLFYEEPAEFKTESRRSLIEAKSLDGYSIYDLVKSLLNHKGSFEINGHKYFNFSYNDFNLYFFTEDYNKTCMVIYDPIINIEKEASGYTIISYPNNRLTISLMKD